jgi:hypothetical protein
MMYVRFEGRGVVKISSTVFQHVTARTCNVANSYHLDYSSTLNMEAEYSTESFMSIYQTKWHNIPEYRNDYIL